MEITSLTHPIVKRLVKLRQSRKERYEQKCVGISGTKQVSEIRERKILLVERGFDCSLSAEETYIVTKEILKKVSGQASPEPLAALVSLPEFANLEGKSKVVALDNINDPGNVGTLLRTALALGYEGAFLTNTSADPFNDKALRAAMGAAFRLPLQIGTEVDLIALASHFSPLVADMEGIPLFEQKNVRNPLLILGSEAHGVSSTLKERFPKVSIPIQGIESLNVAAAGAILLYNLVYER